MPQLRDGTTNTDPRLDRLVQFDQRSRAFPLLTSEDAGQPLRSMSWKTDVFLDQGQEGACVEFGLLHRLLARKAILTAEQAREIAARHGLYWPAQMEDPWAGGSYPGANPFYEGTSVLAGLQVAKRLGLIGEYRWTFGIRQALIGLGYKSGLVFGLEWLRGMSQPDERGFIEPTGPVDGGHCIYGDQVKCVFVAGSHGARGFGQLDQQKSWVGFHQSWGEDHGDGGRVRITVEHLAWLLDRQGEACAITRRPR